MGIVFENHNRSYTFIYFFHNVGIPLPSSSVFSTMENFCRFLTVSFEVSLPSPVSKYINVALTCVVVIMVIDVSGKRISGLNWVGIFNSFQLNFSVNRSLCWTKNLYFVV